MLNRFFFLLICGIADLAAVLLQFVYWAVNLRQGKEGTSVPILLGAHLVLSIVILLIARAVKKDAEGYMGGHQHTEDFWNWPLFLSGTIGAGIAYLALVLPLDVNDFLTESILCILLGITFTFPLLVAIRAFKVELAQA